MSWPLLSSTLDYKENPTGEILVMLKPAPLTCFLTIMFFLSPDAHTKPLLINQCRFIPPVIFPPKKVNCLKSCPVEEFPSFRATL